MSGPERWEPPEDNTRLRDAALETTTEDRDATAAIGTPGEAGGWRRAVEGAKVALARRNWEDARWSYLYARGTSRYLNADASPDGSVPEAARRMRRPGPVPAGVQGPILRPAVWTWEVPLYFWLGGIATGSSFVAVAADLAGDEDTAKLARKITLGTIGPGAPLLIKDLGRPERFLNMLRIFKPRSPMSMGSWTLMLFSTNAGMAVAADMVGLQRLARGFGAATAALGLYLGSYTGVLLSATATPLWARSRLYLPPIFVCTAVATGAAANRIAAAAAGVDAGHPTRRALGFVETGAMAAELALSSVNERRLGRIGRPLHEGSAGKLFKLAKLGVRVGLGLRLAGRYPAAHHAASAAFLAAGLAFRYAWVGAGKASALDHDTVAAAARAPERLAGREQV